MFGQFLRCLVSPKAVGPRRFSLSPVSRSASSVKKDAAALQRLMKTDLYNPGLVCIRMVNAHLYNISCTFRLLDGQCTFIQDIMYVQSI